MEFMKAIDERMSIRSFLDKEVEDDLIEKILLCGHKAPSAGNIQPWEFIVVRNTDIKTNIVKTTFVGNDENSAKNQDWMLTAPVFIVVCANVQRSAARYGKKAAESLIFQDCSACIENMLLAIVDLKLASCYVSGFRVEELKQVLHLPDGILPIAVLPLGYADIIPNKRPKRNLQEHVHYEHYGNKNHDCLKP